MSTSSQLETPKISNIPHHVAIIMDGNGRWAKKRGMPRVFGHKMGSNAVRKTIEAAVKIGVKYLSLYTFSADNWQRPNSEVSSIMKLIEENLKKELPELHEKGVKIQVLGRLNEIPASLQKEFGKAVQLTKNNSTLILQIAINYSGYNEIIDAVKKMAEQNKLENLSEVEFRKFLYAPEIPFPDLLIRTGGERRISNFLLWQMAYTEFWFTDVLWPNFTEKDFIQALEDYSRRHRRFGGVGEI